MESEPGANANLGRPDPVPKPRPTPVPNGGAAGFPVEIAGYRIQRVLGSGGMATVFAATQSHPRRIVALKVMKPALAADGAKVAHRRFKREVEILGKLHHPYIAQVYEAGVHDENGPTPVPYFVMEYVGGAKTILEHIAANQLDVRERLKMFAKVCAGVEHAHRNKVIHRDLKPSNILIDEYGQPKIIDFGVAHAAELDVISQTMNTEAGRLVGTLSYMSPEQVDGQPTDLDARCDVYALGALLYKMLTGRAAHDLDGKSVYQAVRIIRERAPIRPSEYKPELRGDLETIILKALEQDRARRYRNAGSLGRDVVRYLEHRPIHARRAGALHGARLFAKRHRPALTAAVIASLVIAAGLGIIAFERTKTQGEKDNDQHSLANPALSHNDRFETQLEHGDVRRSGSLSGTSVSNTTVMPFDINVHAGRINEIAMANTSEGIRMASGARDHKLVLWDITNRHVLHDLSPFRKSVTHVCLSANGRFAVAASDADPMQIISLEDGRVVSTIRHRSGAVSAIAMNAEGSKLAFAGEDLTIRIIATEVGEATANPPSAQPEMTLRSGTGVFTCMTFNADGTQILAGSQQGPVYLWRVADGALIRRFSEVEGEVAAVAFGPILESQAATQPDGAGSGDAWQRVMAISSDGRAHVWTSRSWSGGPDDPIIATDFNACDSGRRNRINATAGTMNAAAFSPDGTRLAVAVQFELIVWDMLGSRPKPGAPYAGGQTVIGSPTILEESPTALAIDPGNDWCAVGAMNGNIRVVPIGG